LFKGLLAVVAGQIFHLACMKILGQPQSVVGVAGGQSEPIMGQGRQDNGITEG
jgi:hypothetical protein